jgi:hypothetical protein
MNSEVMYILSLRVTDSIILLFFKYHVGWHFIYKYIPLYCTNYKDLPFTIDKTDYALCIILYYMILYYTEVLISS